MHTSGAQVDGILDPDKGNVTIELLQRAAALVGRQLRFELVWPPVILSEGLRVGGFKLRDVSTFF